MAVCGFAAGATTLVGHDASVSPFALRDGLVGAAPVFAVALVVQLLAVLVHECAHALVAQVLKVPVRALGFAMLFFFMPVAYVDRTDAYRVRSRGGRLALALAGIVSDGILCGATALVASNASGLVQQVALVLLAYQLLGLLFNVNPLLPTDGYVALEISLGLVDLRGRSFALVGSLLRRRELPPYLARLGRAARTGYVLYAVFASAYVVAGCWQLPGGHGALVPHRRGSRGAAMTAVASTPLAGVVDRHLGAGAQPGRWPAGGRVDLVGPRTVELLRDLHDVEAAVREAAARRRRRALRAGATAR